QLRTRNSPSVETRARKPSHLSSKDHPEPEGSGPGRESIGSGSRRAQNLPLCIFAEPEQLSSTSSGARLSARSGGKATRLRVQPRAHTLSTRRGATQK